MADVVKSRYELRGRPAAYTGWSPGDMRKHSAWQLDQLASKRLRTSQLGGSSWDLPKRLEHGKPSPLPETVLRYVQRMDSVGHRSETWLVANSAKGLVNKCTTDSANMLLPEVSPK